MIIPVCLSSDKNFLQHMAVAMASILESKNADDAVHFYILENDFTQEDRKKLGQLKSIADFEITYIKTDDIPLKIIPLRENDRLSAAAYARLFIPDLIPSEDKIIYLDCDIVVRKSLAELYAMNPLENYVLGVRDFYSRRNRKRMGTQRYINSGVMLLNAKKMRDDAVSEKFISYITKYRNWTLRPDEHRDQDVIAAVLDGNVQYISYKWNGFVKSMPTHEQYWQIQDAYILHFVGSDKPWMPNARAIMADEYFRYLRLTPFAENEKIYRKQRLRWFFSKIPSNVMRLIRSKKSSRLRTHETTFFFGIPIHRKKKQ